MAQGLRADIFFIIMYSKELEELIESVLADGVVTENERAVLRKRAEACGEDPDEVMVVVEGRLAKISAAKTPTREKRGNIVTCPNCGATIQAGALKCSECGYIFSNVKANTSFTKLFDKIQEIQTDALENQNERIIATIKNFPIPNSQEDLNEFLSMASSMKQKKGNFITLNPALSGALIVVGVLLIFAIFAGIAIGLDDKGNTSIIEGIVLSIVGVAMAAGWWLPFVVGAIMHEVMNKKANQMKKENAIAEAWDAKCKQVEAKLQIVSGGF